MITTAQLSARFVHNIVSCWAVTMRIVAIVVVSLLISAPASAQQSAGSIAGRVVDPQGASTAGALVTAKNPRTGYVRSERTDMAGLYRLTALPPGSYDVIVEASGFATLVQEGVGVAVAQTQTLNVTLQIGTIAQDVSVTATLPLTDVTSSSVGETVDTQRLQALPLNGRQFANLAATLPGVGLAYHSDPTKGSNYAPLVNGGAGRNINYQIDGGDNNDDTVGGLLQQFPLEAVQEFRFDTQRFKAEYGRSNGGVMNVVTKSGTNRYEGTLFELFRDKGMNALTETEKLAGAAGQSDPRKGDYRRHQFGGSFGGPLMMDRLHFFFALERTEQNTTQTVNTRGLFPEQDGVFPTPLRENLGSVKVSATINPAQYLTLRYGRNRNRFPFNASPTTTPDNWADATNQFNSVNAGHNWVAGGSKLNEVVFQYSDYSDHIVERTQADTLVFPNGVMTGSSLAAPQRTEQVKYQIRDDFSWLLSGRGGLGHTLKAGASFINEPRLFIEAATAKDIIVYVMRDVNASGPVRSVSMNDGEASANIPTKQYRLLRAGRLAAQSPADLERGRSLRPGHGAELRPVPEPELRQDPDSGTGWIAGRHRWPRTLRAGTAERSEQHSAAYRRRLRHERRWAKHRARGLGHLHRFRLHQFERAAGSARRERPSVRRRLQRHESERPQEP